jgi:integrase
MARPAKGQVLERPTSDGDVTFALRFRAYGKREYVTLGTKAGGWSRGRAEEELQNVLADVRRGIWKPAAPDPVEAPAEAPTFHVFASQWFKANEGEWSERTIADYKWALELHVLPFFKDFLLTEITIEVVDRFKAAKLKDGKLAPAQINKCIKRVSQILEVAEEYDLIPKNTARGKKRKAKEPKVRRSWVEPEQAMALIEESSTFMRPVVATLIGSGLRVGEACALEWDDISLATGTIRVGKAKTDAGTDRELDLPAGLVAELEAWYPRSERLLRRWRRGGRSSSPVFLSEHGGEVRRQSEANVSRRLKTSIKRANVKLVGLDIDPISDKVTPHSLRRTYASIRAALKDDPLYVSEQMGHKDVRFTLNVYSRAVKRRVKLHGAHLAEFDRTLAWAELPTAEKAQTGTNARDVDNLAQELLKDSAL